MKVYELVNNIAKRYCGKYIFGIPGSYIMPIWQNMKDFEIVLCTNEADAGYIAAGYSREIRKPTILLTTASPGVTNAISGIASAFKDYVPLIIISGAVKEMDKGRGAFQEESNIGRNFEGLAISKAITKKNYYLNDAKNAGQVLQDAFYTATSGRAGCVHISIPVDIQAQEIEDSDLPHEIILGNSKEESIPPEIIKDIVLNERILIIAGWGIYLARAEKKFAEFVQKYEYPFLATMKGLYCVDMSQKNFLGKLGMGYTEEISEFLKEYQPKHILCFGTSLGKTDLSEAFLKSVENAKIWAFTKEIDSYKEKNKHINWVHTEDLNVLLEKYIQIKNTPNGVDKCFSNNVYQKAQNRMLSQIGEDMLMAKAIRALNAYADPDVLVTADAGNHYLDAVNLFQTRSQCGFWIDAGLAAMGNGICGTIGMAFGGKHKRYICITGDGCTLMNGNSIYVAAKYQLPIIFIVFNNQSLGRVRVGQREMNGYIASDITNVNFAKYGEALGAIGRTVCNLQDFVQSVELFMQAGETFVLEVITNKDERPLSL